MSLESDDQPPPNGWERWISTSPAAPLVGAVIAVCAGLALIVTGSVIVAAWVRDRPTSGLGILVIPAVPILGVGQLWAIGQMRLRQPRRPSGRRRFSYGVSRSGGSFSLTDQRKFFFGDLRPALGNLLLACFFAGWIAGFVAVSGLNAGTPTGARPGCPFPLQSHGAITCVTRGAYQHVGATDQRFTAGVLFSFFSLDLGGGLSSLAWFRRPSIGGPTSP